MNYPSPFDTCGIVNCNREKACQKYRAWINAWWKNFNGWPRRFRSCKHMRLPEKFIYNHHDRVRRYLEKSPCESCTANEKCQKPCQMYLRWYDARMRWHEWRFDHADEHF